MADPEKKEPWLIWDSYKLAERWAKANLEDQKENPDSYDEDDPTTEDGWMDVYYESPHLSQSDWDHICSELTDWMDGEDAWHCEADGIGWRKLSGSKDFQATSGEDLLRAVLPDTECTFSIYKEEDAKMLRIVNSHHDAHGEVYLIIPDPTQ